MLRRLAAAIKDMDKPSQTEPCAAPPSLDVSSLLCLPDELLLYVAQSLSGKGRQASLCALLLVNRHLGMVVKEELYSAPSLKPTHAHQLVSQLLDEPKFANKVNSLEILDNDKKFDKVEDWDWINHEFRDGEVEEPSSSALSLSLKCQNALHAHKVDDSSWRWAAGLQTGDDYAYVAFIPVITPNLRGLSISKQYAKFLSRKDSSGSFGTPPRPYLAKGFNHVSQNLRQLSISSTTNKPPMHDDRSWTLSTLDMRPLTSVTLLTVPFSCLLSFGTQVSSLDLPPNLQSFRVTDCLYGVVEFLECFLSRERHRYPFLKDIESVWREKDMTRVSKKLTCHVELGLFTIYKTAEHEGVKVRWVFEGGKEDRPQVSTNV